ncbi:hypothetical protein [Bifidobacterium breve]|uniref:hypothetical protein n=1 Tax=Bifidobacterium breve TaxID=1685 RepID=UPI00080BBF02|nr:hypothetical protein [Bifidobacterium breve]
MENRILIQLSLNEEEKPMYSWKTRMAKTAAAVLAGALALSGCGGGTGTTNAKGGPSVADTITAQVAYSSRDFNPLSTSMALPMGRVLVIVATPDLPQGGSGDEKPSS